MRILAIEHEMPTPAHTNLREILRDEARAVWDLQKRDVLRDIWFTASDRRAILLLECANATAAREQLAALPLVRLGYSDFDVLELHGYDGYERLFAQAGEPAIAVRREEPAEY